MFYSFAEPRHATHADRNVLYSSTSLTGIINGACAVLTDVLAPYNIYVTLRSRQGCRERKLHASKIHKTARNFFPFFRLTSSSPFWDKSCNIRPGCRLKRKRHTTRNSVDVSCKRRKAAKCTELSAEVKSSFGHKKRQPPSLMPVLRSDRDVESHHRYSYYIYIYICIYESHR